MLELTSNLQALAYRMQELMDARESPQAQLLVREMLTDVRAWRLKVQEAFQGWSRDSAVAPAEVLRERLTARLGLLEARIEETLNKAGGGRAHRPGRRALLPPARRLPGSVGGGPRICGHRGGDRVEPLAGVAVLIRPDETPSVGP